MESLNFTLKKHLLVHKRMWKRIKTKNIPIEKNYKEKNSENMLIE
jgi:hypothetical protein